MKRMKNKHVIIIEYTIFYHVIFMANVPNGFGILR